AANQYRLPDGAKRGRQAFMAGAESSGRALAMNEKRAALAAHQMRLDLAGVVGNIEQQVQIPARKEMPEDAAGEVTENLAIGEGAVDGRAHRAEVALTDIRRDWRAGQFAVRKRNARRLRGDDHVPQEFRADLVAEPARAAMNGHNDVVLSKVVSAGSFGVENLCDGLHFEVMIP